VSSNHFANSPPRSRAGVDGATNGCDISADDCCHETCVDLFPADEAHVCRFDHRIGSLDHRHETFAFNQTERF
jgi:hypothetical protein